MPNLLTSILGLNRRPSVRTYQRPAVAWNGSGVNGMEWQARGAEYMFNEAMLANTAYAKQADGGYRESILDTTFGIICYDEEREEAVDYPLWGWFNPVPTIVDCYQNVFRGSWGSDIRIAEQTRDGQDTNPVLLEPKNNPLTRLWQWSNLDTEKQAMQQWAANLGTVGIRIVARDDPNPAKRRVTLQFDHPRTIVDYDTDDRGNVTEIELRYKVLAGPLGEKRYEVQVREVFTKKNYVREVDGEKVIDEPNLLGFTPYVLLKHKGNGEYGDWAYKGAEQTIHGINWLISNHGESLYEHIWPTWFAAAGGNKPDNLQVGRKALAYVKMNPDTPTPILEPLVAPLDFAGAIATVEWLAERLMGQAPEMILGNIKALAGQSGETIAKLLTAVEAAIERAKANYEHAVKRALQIGLSEGIRLGLWNLGTGTGVDAADRAYEQGKEDFDFAPRTPLPQSVFDKLNDVKLEHAPQQAKLQTAAMAKGLPVSEAEQLRLAGYTDDQIAGIKRERAQVDVVTQAQTAPL
jgi:hypothetical protein